MAIEKETDVGWKDLNPGAIVTEPGSAKQYPTGGWRSRRPTHELEKCIKCGMCFLYCPEGCIKEQEDGLFLPDLFYCKGCGICAAECPKDVITMVEEEG